MTTEMPKPLNVADELDKFIEHNVLDETPTDLLDVWFPLLNQALSFEGGLSIKSEQPILSDWALRNFYHELITSSQENESHCVLLYQIWMAVKNKKSSQRNNGFNRAPGQRS